MHENPNCKKVKGSHLLLISCGYCKTDIAEYQKLGRGNVLRMYINRIVKSSIDLSKDLICPNCGSKLGTRITMKKKNKDAFKMIRSRYNTKKIDY